jgi:hypothetical protein
MSEVVFLAPLRGSSIIITKRKKRFIVDNKFMDHVNRIIEKLKR